MEKSSTTVKHHMASTSVGNAASTSTVSSMVRSEKSGYDKLPKEMREMKIREEKSDNHEDKVEIVLVFLEIFILILHFSILQKLKTCWDKTVTNCYNVPCRRSKQLLLGVVEQKQVR